MSLLTSEKLVMLANKKLLVRCHVNSALYEEPGKMTERGRIEIVTGDESMSTLYLATFIERNRLEGLPNFSLELAHANFGNRQSFIDEIIRRWVNEYHSWIGEEAHIATDDRRIIPFTSPYLMQEYGTLRAMLSQLDGRTKFTYEILLRRFEGFLDQLNSEWKEIGSAISNML